MLLFTSSLGDVTFDPAAEARLADLHAQKTDGGMWIKRFSYITVFFTVKGAGVRSLVRSEWAAASGLKIRAFPPHRRRR